MTGIGYAAAGVIAVLLAVGAVLTKRPVRALLSGAMQGICALAAVNVTGMFTGVTLGVTAFSAVVCAALGLPGTVMLLVLQAIIGQ